MVALIAWSTSVCEVQPMNQQPIRTSCLAAIVVTTMLVACSAPGAPKLRTSSDDGQGPLVPNCQNVSLKKRVFEHDTRSYHSTWSSAWLEGTQAGFKEGLNLKEETNKRALYKKDFAYAMMLQLFGIDGRNPPFPPFCMRFDASQAVIHKALSELLPKLGNTLVRDKEEFGLFGTEFIDREHMSAKWRDRYVITVQETTTDQIDVTVFRELLISRQDYPYDRAESNGHNEAWLLQQIGIAVSK